MWVWMNQADFDAIKTGFDTVNKKLDALLAQQGTDHRLLTAVKTEEDQMAQTLDDCLTDITDLKSKADGLIALTTNIKAQLDAITAGALTPAQQAKVDAVFAAVETRKTAVVTAIDANTPNTP